jgi:hypothetical protein
MSQDFTRKIRQARTLAARKRDVPTMRPAFELIDCKGQTG